jgi:ribonuclease D
MDDTYSLSGTYDKNTLLGTFQGYESNNLKDLVKKITDTYTIDKAKLFTPWRR